jgi:small subunit ribosomal protein S7
VARRVPAPDAKYNNRMVSRVVNKLMIGGKKGVAERIMYGALDRIEATTHRHPIETFEVAFRNVTPSVEVKPRRIGGATYQVPSEIRPERR